MLALSALKSLFGPSGYRVYSEAIGRNPNTFNRNVSDPSTVTNKLVLTSCRLLKAAEAAGACPRTILDHSAAIYMPMVGGKSWLQSTFEDILGSNAVADLAEHLSMSEDAVLRAIGRESARYGPHFRIMATAMIALKRKGRAVVLDPKTCGFKLFDAA